MPLSLSTTAEILEGTNDKFWRQEVISRVRQHRARRRGRAGPHSNLELDFQEGEASARTGPEEEAHRLRPLPRPEPKIIEFPRPASAQLLYTPPFRRHEAEDLELADPVVKTPRILDVPEPPPVQMDLLPAFADIRLESEEGKRTGEVELPFQPAPLAYRVFAAWVDLVVVLMASLLFVFGFLLFVPGLPPARLSIVYGLMVTGALWLIYQYLFLVYSSATPGMQLARLEICTFANMPLPVSLRRWRVLASALSALAAGLGFAWALVDDNTLGWHDRITQTYLKRM